MTPTPWHLALLCALLLGKPAEEPRITFEGHVRPLLTRTCTPCHNPGGKMYAKLPFDQPEVVRSHKEGVLRRLKGDDRRLVETWIASSAH